MARHPGAGLSFSVKCFFDGKNLFWGPARIEWASLRIKKNLVTKRETCETNVYYETSDLAWFAWFPLPGQASRT